MIDQELVRAGQCGNIIRQIAEYCTEQIKIVGEENVLNETNTYFPAENVFVINEWWKKTANALWERQPINAPSSIIPDVVAYHYKGTDDFDLYGCKKLKKL